jgi:small GTP-binding protein
VGDSSVGKSSILTRFVDDSFDDNLLATIGVDFKFRRIKINNDDVKIQIWDTAGNLSLLR